MSTNDIPEWAKQRAYDLANVIGEELGTAIWKPQEIPEGVASSALTALARYIAQHEQHPVDPDIVEAEQMTREWLCSPSSMSHKELALAAIKRGRELAEMKK